MKTKNGLYVLSDIPWFVFFVILAAIIFFFFYRPLGVQIGGNLDTELVEDTQAHAIAMSVPRMQVGPGHGLNSGKPLSDILREHATHPENEELKEIIDETLRTTLDNQVMKTSNEYDSPKVISLAVAYAVQDSIQEESCLEVVFIESFGLCRLLAESPRIQDTSGVNIPDIRGHHAWSKYDLTTGFVHIPSEVPVTIYTSVAYGDAS